MECCNGNCNQGRNCPNRPKGKATWKVLLHAAIIAGLIALFGVVGRMDYDAAQVTAQIVNSAASNGR